MLSFDDPITDRIINTLKSLFSGSIRNPNGCAIKGTFFVSHQWNNYDQSLWLHSTNHEIGVNSITREDLSGRTQERWYKEQKGMRETLAEFSFIDRSHIIGTRAPELKIGGDAQYRMMSENNFTFDNSMLVSSPYWPQTLDHKLAWECDGNCPTQSHKAIWEIPIQNIQANDTRWYKTLTRAMKPFDSRDSVTKMLQRNFMNHYKTNHNGAVYALRDFLKFIVQKQDVFVVTGSQIIDYMRNPVDLNNIKSLRSWQILRRAVSVEEREDNLRIVSESSLCVRAKLSTAGRRRVLVLNDRAQARPRPAAEDILADRPTVQNILEYKYYPCFNETSYH
nr:hypothetical protein F48E3.8 - Caenorhabditis elegans [Caenorhabditis elegans]